MSFKLYFEGFFDREKVILLFYAFGFFKYIFCVPLLLNPSILIVPPPPVLTVFFETARICFRFLAEYLFALFDGDLLLLGELLTDLKAGLTIVKFSLRLTDYS